MLITGRSEIIAKMKNFFNSIGSVIIIAAVVIIDRGAVGCCC